MAQVLGVSKAYACRLFGCGRILAHIDSSQLSAVAKALLAAMGLGERFQNLADVNFAERISPPLILSDYPTIGGFPEFERYGVIL